MAAAADLAGVARTLKQQAGVRSLVPLKDALALLAQVNATSSFAKPNVSLTFRRHTRTAEAPLVSPRLPWACTATLLLVHFIFLLSQSSCKCNDNCK
jgi:hypothetical protein